MTPGVVMRCVIPLHPQWQMRARGADNFALHVYVLTVTDDHEPANDAVFDGPPDAA